MRELLGTIPQVGKVDWIGLRSGRGQAVLVVDHVLAHDNGLEGDFFSGPKQAKRQVTLIQAEHLPVIAQLLGVAEICPTLLRRNIVVSGINLLALKNNAFRIGDATLFGTGPCAPCSKMETCLGPGGYNAMRGHGGITAHVMEGGPIQLGDSVAVAVKND